MQHLTMAGSPSCASCQALSFTSELLCATCSCEHSIALAVAILAFFPSLKKLSLALQLDVSFYKTLAACSNIRNQLRQLSLSHRPYCSILAISESVQAEVLGVVSQMSSMQASTSQATFPCRELCGTEAANSNIAVIFDLHIFQM